MNKKASSVNTIFKENKFKNSYGMFKDSTISEKDIDEVISMWDKKVDELVEELKQEK